jgi:hypothetical protein
MVKEFIIESKKYGNHTVLVDEEDWDKVKNRTWRLYYDTRIDRVTSVRTNVIREPRERRNPKFTSRRGWEKAGFKERQVKIHNFILDRDPRESKLIVDHINGNVLDNRKCNLRVCTRAENSRNLRKSRNNTSGYTGVSKNKNRWCASIAYNNRRYYIGSFVSKEEAARARDLKAIELHGEFASLNFPREEYK